MGRLFAASTKMVFRNRQALFCALVFPVIFVVVFGLFNFDRPPTFKVAIVESGSSATTSAMRHGLEAIGVFHVRLRSAPEARRELDNGDIDLIVVSPTSVRPGRLAVVQVRYKQGNQQTTQAALTMIRQVVDGMSLRMAGVAAPPLEMRATGVSARNPSYYDWLLPGLVAMGVMNFSIQGIAVAIARYREQRILKQILVSPLRPVKFLVGEIGAHLLLSVVQSALILAIGMTLFHGHVYGNIAWLFVLVLLANVIFLNLGVAVAGRATTVNSASGVANVIALPMMFLSGVFFGTDMLPKVVQGIVRYLPLTPLLEALRKVAVDGASITATGHQIVFLAAWVVVSFGLAAANFRFART